MVLSKYEIIMEENGGIYMEDLISKGMEILPAILVVIAVIVLITTGLRILRIISTIALVGSVILWCVVLPLRDTETFLVTAEDIKTIASMEDLISSKALVDKETSRILSVDFENTADSIEVSIVYEKDLLDGYVTYKKSITYKVDKSLIKENNHVEVKRTFKAKQVFSNLTPKVYFNLEQFKSEFKSGIKQLEGGIK